MKRAARCQKGLRAVRARAKTGAAALPVSRIYAIMMNHTERFAINAIKIKVGTGKGRESYAI